MEQSGKMQKALELLGNPHLLLRNVFHITGTAGKTSIGIYMSSILRQAGYSVNMYANGNIYPNNRRTVLDGTPITDNELSSHIAYIQSETSTRDLQCNEEETLFLATLRAFENNPAEVNIIEVATGSMEDPTNIFQQNQPLANIVSTIHVDHITTNGNTPELNAVSQSGTIGKNTTVILGQQTANVNQFFNELKAIQGYKIYRLGKEFWIDTVTNAQIQDKESPAQAKSSQEGQILNQGSINWQNQLTFSTEWNSTILKARQIKYLPYQLQNIAVALMAIEEYSNIFSKVNASAISAGLQTASVKGQMQMLSVPEIKAISQQHNVYVDYATNPLGARQIKDGIIQRQALLKQNTHIVLSADRSSNTAGLLNELKGHIKSCTIMPNLNTISPVPAKELLQTATNLKVPNASTATNLLDAIKAIARQDPSGQTIILGCASLASTMGEI